MRDDLNFMSSKCKTYNFLEVNTDTNDTLRQVEKKKMNEPDLKSTWFKNWTEKHYNKLNQNYESSQDEEKYSANQFKKSTSHIPLNKLLDKIPLAYSPITKQLHVLTAKEQGNVGDQNYQSINGSEDIQISDDESQQFWTKTSSTNKGGEKMVQHDISEFSKETEENKWNNKFRSFEQKPDPCDLLMNEDFSRKRDSDLFSNIVCNKSENLASHSEEKYLPNKLAVVDNDDLSIKSHCSHDSGSALEESSQFFEKKNLWSKVNKQKGLSGFFNRSIFTWKSGNSLSTHGWKIFEKIQSQYSNSPNGDAYTQHVRTDSPLSQNKYEHLVVSSSALILHNRPENLPAKSLDEQEKHRLEYEQIIEAAKKKEVNESKKKKKQLQQQLKFEEQLTNALKIWNHEIIPKWDTMKNSKKTRDLWWSGIPPSVRGKIWKLAIGNELNITHQLYEICSARAQERLKNIYSNTQGDFSDIADKECSVELIQLDISRTFPQLCIFQKGGPYYDILHCLLGAYACYRPDVGYVQGMSFIAAILILNLEPADAFICFANLLNRPCHIAFFRLNQSFMHAYYDTYNGIFKENLPKLFQHFQQSSLTPDLYLLDWVYSVFAKAMPLDIACRVWDVFLRDGEEFLFKTALGVLHLYQDKLFKLDFVSGAQFLTKLPEDLSADLLFKSVDSIKMCIGKIKFNQILANFMEKSVMR